MTTITIEELHARVTLSNLGILPIAIFTLEHDVDRPFDDSAEEWEPLISFRDKGMACRYYDTHHCHSKYCALVNLATWERLR